MTYDERRTQLSREVNEAHARYNGFVRAEIGEMVPWSSRANEQAAFAEGYVQGKALLGQPMGNWFETAKAITRAAYPQNAKDAAIEDAVEAAWAEKKMHELGL